MFVKPAVYEHIRKKLDFFTPSLKLHHHLPKLNFLHLSSFPPFLPFLLSLPSFPSPSLVFLPSFLQKAFSHTDRGISKVVLLPLYPSFLNNNYHWSSAGTYRRPMKLALPITFLFSDLHTLKHGLLCIGRIVIYFSL